MNDLNALLAVAGVLVTLLVVAAMILLVPKGAEPSHREVAPLGEAPGPLVPAAEAPGP